MGRKNSNGKKQKMNKANQMQINNTTSAKRGKTYLRNILTEYFDYLPSG